MQIRNKIPLQHLAIVAIVLAFSFALVYISCAHFRKKELIEKLENKSQLVIREIRENFTSVSDIEKNSLIKNISNLPAGTIWIIDKNKKIIYSNGLPEQLPEDVFPDLKKGTVRYVKSHTTEFVTTNFSFKNHQLFVICSAKDVSGFKILHILRNVLFLVILLCLIGLLFLQILYRKKSVKPIDKLTKEVNDIDIQNIEQRISDQYKNRELILLARTINRMLSSLEETIKTQREFIANASHELRTPLTSITGNLEVTLLKERPAKEYKTILSSTLDDVKGLNKLTNRLLVLLRTGTAINESAFTDIRADDVLWKVRTEYLKIHKTGIVNIAFDTSIKGENNLLIKGNQELIKTAFLNLIDNGCKYSYDNKVNIHLSTGNSFLKIAFSDNGIGIPENEINKVYQPFYRASNVKGQPGHGIGLSLVERIMHFHNGQISIISRIKNGSTFDIIFPLVR